ncbi:TPA: GatB/YqeY domain-containing protein, partial [Campylobacter coli]|nr:GatB/YqeY domain-containing protein [Campylobacter coli]
IELSDERILKIIASEIKKRKDAIELYSKGGREDLAQKEQKEIALFESYLPQQLSDEELQAALKEMIANLGVSSLKDQGLVMKEAKAKFGARVDGKRLNVTLRELLN